MPDRKLAEKRGRRAESMAAFFLWMKGYRILAKRYRTPMGEIDLIARKKNTIAFIEVKARKSLMAGHEAIHPRQRRRLAHAALHFIMQHPELADYELRFDALIVTQAFLPQHIIDAWSGNDYTRL